MHSTSLQKLSEQLSKMPTIGSRTAMRLAYYIAKTSNKEIDKLLHAIKEVKKHVQYCTKCFNISEDPICDICRDKSRDRSKICVIGQPQDIDSIEKTGSYNGLYHVLLGVLSPLDNIGPSDIRIGELIQRIKKSNGVVKEVIIATNPNANGEATALYIQKALSQLEVKTSRIGFGIAIGSDISYIDKSTLSRSFQTRVKL